MRGVVLISDLEQRAPRDWCFSELSYLAGVYLWFVLVNEQVFWLDACTLLLQMMQSQMGAEGTKGFYR